MSVLDTLANETIKNKIKNGIQLLQSDRLNSTTQKLIEHQKIITLEKQSLIEKENHLNKWKEELAARKKKMPQLFKKIK